MFLMEKPGRARRPSARLSAFETRDSNGGFLCQASVGSAGCEGFEDADGRRIANVLEHLDGPQLSHLLGSEGLAGDLLQQYLDSAPLFQSQFSSKRFSQDGFDA